MLSIIIFKWLIVFAAIWLAFYHYRLEREKISIISKNISDPDIRRELQSNARRKMFYLVFFFTAFIAWVMSYDLVIDNVRQHNEELIRELEVTSRKFDDLSSDQQRLVEASTEPDAEVREDIKTYYTDIFVNFYIMRNCDMVETDDMFIINSALLREIGLNGMPFTLRDEVIMEAKSTYLSRFSTMQCDQIYGKHNKIMSNYRNYIATVREVLRGTF